MSRRDAYEPGVPCWVTAMTPDVHAAAAYYGGVFGWANDRALWRPLRHRGTGLVAMMMSFRKCDPGFASAGGDVVEKSCCASGR